MENPGPWLKVKLKEATFLEGSIRSTLMESSRIWHQFLEEVTVPPSWNLTSFAILRAEEVLELCSHFVTSYF